MVTVFRDNFGNRGRVWHIDAKHKTKSEKRNYQAVGICGTRLTSYAEFDSWPDSKTQKLCVRCQRARVAGERGTFIELYWEYEPSAYYVRGHVTPEEFAEAVQPFLGGEVARDLVTDTVEHSFARWVPTPHGDNDRVIRNEPTKKRGCFAVTVVRPTTTRASSAKEK